MCQVIEDWKVRESKARQKMDGFHFKTDGNLSLQRKPSRDVFCAETLKNHLALSVRLFRGVIIFVFNYLKLLHCKEFSGVSL